MTLYATSTPTAGRPRSMPSTYRRVGAMRGLGGTYFQSGDAIPPGTTVITMVTAQPDPVTRGTTHGSGPSIGEIGRPFGLAVMYARSPLLWLFLLFGGGALTMHLLHRFGVMR